MPKHLAYLADDTRNGRRAVVEKIVPAGLLMRFCALLVVLLILPSVLRAQPPTDIDAARPPEVIPADPAVDPPDAPKGYEFSGALRGFYRNDQRIEWSGVEDTFGAEAVLRGRWERQNGPWSLAAQGELFLNLPNGQSILSDPQRDLYRANFTVPTLQVFELFAEAQYGDWAVRLGRFATPMGRYESPMLTNSLIDAPFLRTEVIGFVETGVLVSWHPDIWSFDVGVTNGEPDLDTNSSKALIARAGVDIGRWTSGVWIKAQDGISSEQQKRFNSFVGFDAKYRFDRFTIYSEGAIDEHGLFRDLDREGNPLALAPRSLYGRDVFKSFRQAIHGAGFDVGVIWTCRRFTVDLNYGLYIPEQIGLPYHDEPIHRALAKVMFEVAPRMHLFTVGIVENNRPQQVPLFNNAPPFMVLGGLQFEY